MFRCIDRRNSCRCEKRVKKSFKRFVFIFVLMLLPLPLPVLTMPLLLLLSLPISLALAADDNDELLPYIISYHQPDAFDKKKTNNLKKKKNISMFLLDLQCF